MKRLRGRIEDGGQRRILVRGIELLLPPLPELELLPSEPLELLFPPEPEELLLPPALTIAWLIICWSCSIVIPAIAAPEDDVVGPAEDTILFLILKPSICRM